MASTIDQSVAPEQTGAEPTPMMPKARLGHISIVAQNPAAQAAFYQDLFGLQVVGGGANGAAVFLASYPEEESHDIVFGRDPALAHLAFKVESLADLQAAYRGLRARGLPVITQNHGVSLAAYFRDPEGNLIELYWPTGRTDFYLPVIRPLDLDLPEEQLRQIVRELPSNKRAGAA
jgi:catechol-2,3-dioxygenase